MRRTYAAPLLALMAILGLVLLIACSNLANLLIARASARQKEIAVRLALGAARSRLIRQLLVESLMLSTVGGALGVGLAVLIDRALIAFLPSGHTPLSLSATPDWTVLAFTFGIAMLAGTFSSASRPRCNRRVRNSPLRSKIKPRSGVVRGASVAPSQGSCGSALVSFCR